VSPAWDEEIRGAAETQHVIRLRRGTRVFARQDEKYSPAFWLHQAGLFTAGSRSDFTTSKCGSARSTF
jgi:hypothetical protein